MCVCVCVCAPALVHGVCVCEKERDRENFARKEYTRKRESGHIVDFLQMNETKVYMCIFDLHGHQADPYRGFPTRMVYLY